MQNFARKAHITFGATSLLSQISQLSSKNDLLFIYWCDDVGILDIDSIKSQYSSSVLDRMACKPKRSLEDIIPNAPPDGIDMVKKLLQFNPDKRLTAEQALKHPFVARFHNPEEEPCMDYDVIPALNDDVQLSVEEYRVKLYEVSACVWFVPST